MHADDEILISQADHHANFVTWHETAKKCGAKIQVLPILDNWLIDEDALIKALNEKTQIGGTQFCFQRNGNGTTYPAFNSTNPPT